MKRIAVVFIIFLLSIQGIFSQSASPSAGELSYKLTSPVFLGGGSHITRTETPQGAFLNPASAAGYQRFILDLNYINLEGIGSGASGMGHSINAAASIPSKIGVFSVGLGFLDTSKYAGTLMDLGTSGRIFTAFSKEIYSDIWVGAGIDGSFGSLDGKFQGGAALNLGFLHFPGNVGKLKNFSWGLTLSGLGYRYGSASNGYFNSIPENITPAAGVAFDIVDNNKFRWKIRGDIRVPSFTDIWFGVANDLYFGNSTRLSVSSSLSIRDAAAGAWQTVIPSVAVGVNFPLGRSGDNNAGNSSLKTSEMEVQAAAAPLYDGVWGFGAGITLPFGIRDENPPEITVDYQSPQYISPNYDGIQDELIFPYTAEDERYITSYKWKIVNSSNSTVRTFVNKDERPENESIKNLWSRLISPETGTALPVTFRWDGVTDSGSVAKDGEYSVYMEFSDDNGNTSEAGPFEVIIDTVAPSLTLDKPEGLDLIFSPDGDGNKDFLSIQQHGSIEDLWEADFSDSAGTAVKSLKWEDSSPVPFKWYGKDNNGKITYDGVYNYSIKSTDAAGNYTEDSINGIIIDTRQPEIGLIIDKPVFSPGTSSSISSINFKPEISARSGIVDWKLEIVDSEKNNVRIWDRSMSPSLPDLVTFDGKDSNGKIIEEGIYRAKLEIEYRNGFRPSAFSPPFTVDRTPPAVSVSVDYPVFSPQGGSVRDKVTFTQKTTKEKEWNAALYNNSGQSVNRWTWLSNAPETFSWDGRDSSGRLVPDGMYTYVLESTDTAGNHGQSKPVVVTVDTSNVSATVTSSLDVFSPGGGGFNNKVDLFLKSKEGLPVEGWELEIVSESGETVKKFSGKGTPPDHVSWYGNDSSGKQVPDGSYSADLTVVYLKGDIAETTSSSITLDTKPPAIYLSVEDGLFSPDGDGKKDSLNIVQSASGGDRFEAFISDSGGNKVRNWVWSGSIDPVTWEGRDDSGNLLSDGSYTYTVSGWDKAGNKTVKTFNKIEIDTAPVPVYLTARKSYIRSGVDDPDQQQVFAAVVPNTKGIVSWIFSIKNKNGKEVYSESGRGSVPDGFTWNGTGNDGKIAEGEFKGILSVVYAKGASPSAESRPFIADGSPPVIDISVSPQPFSPDGDNVDDEAVINLSVSDLSRIKNWSLEISDPRGKDFIAFAGSGRPSERIIWDGRSGSGELVESAEDYPYVFTVTDVLGQSSVKRGEIAVDVLVIREGNRLKILINNITFSPNSPSLVLTGEQGEKNIQVLDRLAEIMKKYSSYKIIIEGHAVSLKWADPAAAKREQENILIPLSLSRARTVVRELAARGVPKNRMEAVGIGGARPIVPHSDVNERWRNRRVEFYLEK